MRRSLNGRHQIADSKQGKTFEVKLQKEKEQRISQKKSQKKRISKRGEKRNIERKFRKKNRGVGMKKKF